MAKIVKMTPVKLERFKNKAEAFGHNELLDQFRFVAGEVSSSTDATIMQNSMEKLFVLREIAYARMVRGDMASAKTGSTGVTESKQETAAKDQKATPSSDSKAEPAAKACTASKPREASTSAAAAAKGSAAKAEDKVAVKA